MIEIDRGNNNCIPRSGIGYVIIPTEVDAAEYVQRCYRNSSLSISGGYNSTYMHNVKVVDGVLDKVKFPNGDDELGSPVVWIRDSFTNRPIIIGTIKAAGDSNMTLTDQQRIYQETAESVVEMFLDALNGRINITAKGGESVPSEIVIQAMSGCTEGDVVRLVSKDKLTGEAKTFDLNLTKNFEITINNGKEDIVKITADEESVEFTDHWQNNIILNATETHFKDQWGNEVIQNEENTQVLTNKFNVGQGVEQMVLGNTLVDLLGQLIDAILNMTVVTHAGPSGTPINAATFSAIKAKLDTALSKLSNTD